MIYAFWIIPKKYLNTAQTPVPTVEITHIDFVIQNPEMFGLTLDQIQETYDKYGEKLRFEGKARDEIIYDLLQKGFVRVTTDIKNNQFLLELNHFDVTDIEQFLDNKNVEGIHKILSHDLQDLLTTLQTWWNKVKRKPENYLYNIKISSLVNTDITLTREDFQSLLRYNKVLSKIDRYWSETNLKIKKLEANNIWLLKIFNIDIDSIRNFLENGSFPSLHGRLDYSLENRFKDVFVWYDLIKNFYSHKSSRYLITNDTEDAVLLSHTQFDSMIKYLTRFFDYQPSCFKCTYFCRGIHSSWHCDNSICRNEEKNKIEKFKNSSLDTKTGQFVISDYSYSCEFFEMNIKEKNNFDAQYRNKKS